MRYDAGKKKAEDHHLIKETNDRCVLWLCVWCVDFVERVSSTALSFFHDEAVVLRQRYFNEPVRVALHARSCSCDSPKSLCFLILQADLGVFVLAYLQGLCHSLNKLSATNIYYDTPFVR